MGLAIVGINYKNTPIDIREKVSFSLSEKIKCGKYLSENGISENIILSTCNRSEIYIYSDDVDDKIYSVINFYEKYSNIDNIQDYIFVKKDKEAIFHVYNVSSGLDSMILCEDQILGQVKDALAFSMENKFSRKILNKLFRDAITSAKTIKTELKISQTPISMVYIAIKLLKQNLGSLKGKKACIIGAGEIGRLALKHLIGEELEQIFVANRTYNNVIDMLQEFPQIKPVKYENKASVLEDVDILITATSAPHIVIAYDDLRDIKNELYIIDLALPRDVEKRTQELNNIHLYDVDDFKDVSDNNKVKRKQLSKIAKDIIDTKVYEFMNWMNSVEVDITIKELNDRCKNIKEEYINHINKRITLSKRDEELLEKMLFGALKKVIREPILNLKELKSQEEMTKYRDFINILFNFEKDV